MALIIFHRFGPCQGIQSQPTRFPLSLLCAKMPTSPRGRERTSKMVRIQTRSSYLSVLRFLYRFSNPEGFPKPFTIPARAFSQPPKVSQSRKQKAKMKSREKKTLRKGKLAERRNSCC